MSSWITSASRFVEQHGFSLFLVVLSLVAAARVAELFVAKRLTLRASARGAVPEREPIFIVMVILHVLPFVLAPLEVLVWQRPLIPVLFAVATLSLLLLAGARIWILRTLGHMWNVRIVKPAHIVSEGPYRYIRHPNYAVVIAELFFLPLVHTAWATCIVLTILNALVLSRRIPAEEKVLFALPDYANTMGNKPRFIPRLASLGSRTSRRR